MQTYVRMTHGERANEILYDNNELIRVSDDDVGPNTLRIESALRLMTEHAESDRVNNTLEY